MDIISFTKAKRAEQKADNLQVRFEEKVFEKVAETPEEIQPLLDQLEIEGGGVLKLKPKLYEINETIRIPSNVTLKGSGRSTIIKIPDNAQFTPETFNFTGTSSDIYVAITNKENATNISIRDLFVDGNGDNQPTDRSMAGIYLKGVKKSEVINCEVYNVSYNVQVYDGYRGFCILTEAVEDVTILGGMYERAGYECIAIRDSSRLVKIDGVSARDGWQHDLQTVRAEEVVISNCTFDSIGTDSNGGLTLHTGNNVSINNCVIRCKDICIKPFDGFRGLNVSNCQLYSSENPTFMVYMSNDETPSGEIFLSNNYMLSDIPEGVGGRSSIVIGSTADGDPVDKVYIVNNMIINRGTTGTNHGINAINGSKEIHVKNNHIIASESSRGVSIDGIGSVNNDISGNTIYASTGIRAICSDSIFSNNIVHAGSWGIITRDDSDYNIITNNNVRHVPSSSQRISTVGDNNIVENNIYE